MALHYGKNVLIIGGVNSSNLPVKRMEGVTEETENLVKDMCKTINNSRLDRFKEELSGNNNILDLGTDTNIFKSLNMGINRYRIIFAIRRNGKRPIVFANSRKNYNTPVIK